MKDDRDGDLLETAVRRPAVEGMQDDPTLRLLAEEVHVAKETRERNVSFPVAKQDLLRLARSENCGPSLLQSIEALPEGSYANANEVLRALAH